MDQETILWNWISAKEFFGNIFTTEFKTHFCSKNSKQIGMHVTKSKC
jgi:hypothetical protein